MTTPLSSLIPDDQLPLTAEQARRLASAVASGEDSVTFVNLATGPAVIKSHLKPHRWAAEVQAYLTWVPGVGRQAPRLLGVSDRPTALVVTAVDGIRLDQADLDQRTEQEVYAQLGAYLARFHASAPARHHTGMTCWLAQRGRQWLALAEDLLPENQHRLIRLHLDALAELGDLPIVPCHLDFTPSNIMVTRRNQVVVIDYEHARYDLPTRDIVRLRQRIWRRRPDLQDAFLDTYGLLSDLDHEILVHMAALDELTQTVRQAGRALPPP